MSEYPKTYQINVRLSYQRNPIKIQALSKDFIGLEPINKYSPLARHNEFVVESGTKWYDLIGFADSLHFAISDRVKKLFEENALTGWNSFPIVIKEHTDKVYHVFFIDSIAAKLTNLEKINNYETDLHEFDLTSWSGTDFFTHAETLLLICTERVKRILVKNKVTNIEIEAYKIKNKSQF